MTARNLNFVKKGASRNDIGEQAQKALAAYLRSGSLDSLGRAVVLVARLQKMEAGINEGD